MKLQDKEGGRGLGKINAAIIGVTLLFLLTGLLTAAGLMWQARLAALQENNTQVVRFVEGAVGALNRTLLGVDVMLASLDDSLGLAKLELQTVDKVAASRLMFSAVQQTLLVRYVALVDQQSTVIASSADSNEQAKLVLPKGFVATVLAEPSPALIISEPAVSYASAERVLYLARYILLSDGTKVLAVAELQLPTLTSLLLQGVNLPDLEVSVERRNGQLLVSAPAIAERSEAAASAPLHALQDSAAALFSKARLSGALAIVTARPTLYGGIYVTASVPVDSALAGWRVLRNLVTSACLVFTVMVLGAGAASIWYVKRMAQARKIIARSKASLDQALESMVTGFLLLDAKAEVVSWNRRYVELFSFVEDAMAHGMPFRDILQQTAQHLMPHADDATRAAWVSARQVQLLEPGTHELQLPGVDAAKIIQVTERRTPEGGHVIVCEDVTLLRAATAEIQQLAFYDALTKLPNRRLLNDRLSQALAACKRSGEHGALFFLDLDRFKSLNDTLGHDMGDLLLQQVAQRLLGSVRQQDTVARLGGDEFVVMIEALGTSTAAAREHAQKTGNAIVARLNQPYQLGQHVHNSTPSVGGTLFSSENNDAVELFKQADVAMYEVKAAGRNAFRLFKAA